MPVKTMTAAKQAVSKTKRTGIVKPTKVLRADLAKRKADLEAKGWTFENKDGVFFANKGEDTTSNYGSFEQLVTNIEADWSEPVTQTEARRAAVKKAKYRELIKKVIVGVDNHNLFEKKFAEIFGENWYESDYNERLTDEDFKQEVADFWLSLSDGNERFLTGKFKSAVKKKIGEPASHLSNDAGAVPLPMTAEHIDLSLIVPSPLPSQVRRRKRFVQAKLEEMAVSVRRIGIVNPITVRSIGGGKFEIVAGERRFKASEIAGQTVIPAIVKELTDLEAAEIQLIENGQREDQHPLDEAFDYQDMKDVLGYDEEEISLRVGKPVGYIQNRLKLKNLAPKPRETFEQNTIPLSHALEIAKYPFEAQEEILSYAFDGFRTDAVYPLKKFIGKIEQFYLLQLKKAPFSIKSEDLRADGLPCVKCPERTNANPLLFSENYSDKDSCLNRRCWEGKTKTHIQIQRRSIVATDLKIADPEKQEKAAAKVPLITREHYVRDHEKPAEKYLERDTFVELSKPGECASAARGVFFNGDRIGQSAWICRDKNCKKHWKSSSGAASAAASSDAGLEEKRIRKEEIFDVGVGEPVRRRVLKKAAAHFNESQTIFNHANAEKFLGILIERMWEMQCGVSRDDAEIIRELVGLDKTELGLHSYDDGWKGFIKVSAEKRAQILFLLLFAHEGKLQKGGCWKSQKVVLEIAREFGIDYQVLDAEERLAQASMKNKDVFRHYLHELEAGNRNAAMPRLWSGGWDAKKRSKE